MNIIDITIWRIIKPILGLKINDIYIFLGLLIILFPISWTFKELNDFWNIINYIFVVPFTITAGRRLVLDLDKSFLTSIKNINPSISEKLNFENIKTVRFFNHNSIIYLIVLVALISQINYIVSDLGILNHQSNFQKWNQLYDKNFIPSLLSKELFFIFYISVQFVLLLFSLICIVGLVQYTSIFLNTFKMNRKLLNNKLPNPPYLGLDDYHVITTSFLKLIFIILANSFTYFINMRAFMPLNLLAFWLLIGTVFVILFIIKSTLDNYLKTEKRNLSELQNNHKDNDLKYMQFAESLMNVKNKIFSLKSSSITILSLLLSVVSIFVAFVKPTWIDNVRLFVENKIIPWF